MKVKNQHQTRSAHLMSVFVDSELQPLYRAYVQDVANLLIRRCALHSSLTKSEFLEIVQHLQLVGVESTELIHILPEMDTGQREEFIDWIMNTDDSPERYSHQVLTDILFHIANNLVPYSKEKIKQYNISVTTSD
jgi:hypothetical protein